MAPSHADARVINLVALSMRRGQGLGLAQATHRNLKVATLVATPGTDSSPISPHAIVPAHLGVGGGTSELAIG